MKKKIAKLILIAIFMISLTACITNKKDDDNNEEPKKEEVDNTNNDIQFSDEVVEIPENSKVDQMFIKLYEYGKEIYDKEEYKNYEIRNGMRFISLNKLSREYDISMFVGEDGTVCDKYNSGLYFKENDKENDGKKLPYFPILIGCSKEEANIK